MTEANIAFVAGLLADPSRAAMCLALAGGEARPAGELAARAGVSAQTASNHLAKLIAGRILRVEQQGRWRYYRLAGPDVGHAVEALAVVAPPLPNGFPADGMNAEARRLRDARTCYSHLAGRLGVALADGLVAERWLEEDGRSYRITPSGARALGTLGIDPRGRRDEPAARRCLDWTERRPHVAGPVGTALATLALDRGWVRRVRGTRAVMVTPAGRVQLKKIFNVPWEERRS
jgi:DNA-binding transcriptional ArsR family regulator